MKTATIKTNQTSLDMVIMACGTLEGAMQIMAANEQSISINPWLYTEYNIPDEVVTNKNTLNYLSQNSITVGNLVSNI